MSFANDTFTVSSDTTLTSHTPDSGGSWTLKWDTTAGTVIASEDRVRGTSDSAPTLAYHSADPATAEYDVEATARFVTGSNNGNPAIIARAAVAGSLRNYLFAYLTKAFSKALIQEVVNGAVPNQAEWTNTFAFDTDYALKLEVRDGSGACKFFIDGVQRAAITIGTLTDKGKAGFSVRLNGRIDNWVATDAGGGTTDGAGSSSITFSGSGVGASNIAASGSSSVTFSASGVGGATVEAAGSSSVVFSASGVSGSAGSDGASSITFTVSGVGASRFDGVGSSSITFSASGVGESTVEGQGAGSSSITFTVAGVGASVAEAQGSSSLTFSVDGRSPETESVKQIGGGDYRVRRRRFILPDNTEVFATHSEVYSILQDFVKQKPTKKKVTKIIPLKDQIEVKDEKVDGKVVTKVTVKPMSIFKPDPEVYEKVIRQLKVRRRRTIELLLLAA